MLNWKYALLSMTLGVVSVSGFASNYEEDDIYFQAKPSKEKKDKKTSTSQSYSTAGSNTASSYLNNDANAPFHYELVSSNATSNGLNIDEDAYNRRNTDDESTASMPDYANGDDFTYTRRLEKFHNPDIVINSGDDDLITYYYTPQDDATSVVNIYINNDYNYPYNWRSPYYNWYTPAWNYYCGSPWGWNWSWGPSWSYSWSWGPSFSWSWGPSWSWSPSWAWHHHWGWGDPWGPAWHRPHYNAWHRPVPPPSPGAVRPHYANSRPGQPGNGYRPSQIPNRPGGARPGSNIGNNRPGGNNIGTARPGTTVRPTSNNVRPGASTPQAQPATPSRPANTQSVRPSNINNNAGSNSYHQSRPASTSRPSNTQQSRPSNINNNSNKNTYQQSRPASTSRPSGGSSFGGSRGGGGHSGGGGGRGGRH